VYGGAHREAVSLSQKQDRNTHPERSGSILNEKRSEKVLLGLCLHLASYVVSFFTPDWVLGPSPRCVLDVLLRRIPLKRPLGTCPHLLWGRGSLLFDPQEAFLRICRQGSLPEPPSGHLISLLQESSASAGSFVLGVSG